MPGPVDQRLNRARELQRVVELSGQQHEDCAQIGPGCFEEVKHRVQDQVNERGDQQGDEQRPRDAGLADGIGRLAADAA